jgi:hypothetical protein
MRYWIKFDFLDKMRSLHACSMGQSCNCFIVERDKNEFALRNWKRDQEKLTSM